MMDPRDNKSVVEEIFFLLWRFGVKCIVCSPGSRNALLIQQAKEVGKYEMEVVVDERSAAFVALGKAMVTRRPVALICTSGTALLNYAPAVAEAYYQGIPLIVLSADRPEEWIDQDDSQTIRQPGVLANFVKASYDIRGNEADNNYLWYANRMVNEGLLKAKAPKQGPVHFNIHLKGNPIPASPLRRDWVRDIYIERSEQKLSFSKIRDYADTVATWRIMVVAGFMPPDNKMQRAFAILEALPNICVMAETVSNLHLPPECYMVDTALFPLEGLEKQNLKPDLIISVGGALISRKLKEYLRKNPPKSHWAVGYTDNLIDCFQSLSVKLEVEPASFLHSFAKRLQRIYQERKISILYRNEWNALRRETIGLIDSLMWSDLKALHIVFNALPPSANLFLGNGTSVRYGQIIPFRLPHAVYANRGVSGIEGCTSTAIGASLGYDGITCLVTGDMSFGYDLGGLACGLADNRLRILVLDNRGGDIFRFIGATSAMDIREEFLCTDKEPPVETLADAYGFEYFYADNETDLKNQLEEFFTDSFAPKIFHLSTRRSNNSGILRDFLTNKKKDPN